MANLANDVQFAKFFHANSYKYSEITEDLPADSPNFSSPFASSVMICQNFFPPKFSHVRYLFIKSSDMLNKNTWGVKKCEANQKQHC